MTGFTGPSVPCERFFAKQPSALVPLTRRRQVIVIIGIVVDHHRLLFAD